MIPVPVLSALVDAKFPDWCDRCATLEKIEDLENAFKARQVASKLYRIKGARLARLLKKHPHHNEACGGY